MAEEKILLVGCGILKKEVRWLIAKNQWPVEAKFLDSALHVDFQKLSHSLTAALAKYQDRPLIVVYGCCHPLMDQMLGDARTFRTAGQNCVEMLLGQAVFTSELEQGAFFLLEEWARRWPELTRKTFGNNPKGIRFVFQHHHTYLLGIRTPCSEDFSCEAETAANMAGLPLRWLDVALDHLETVLQAAIMRKVEDISCPRC